MKKKQAAIMAVLIFIFCLTAPVHSNAESQDNEYQSNGEVSFYGEYVPLTEEEQESSKELPQTTKDKIIYAPLNHEATKQTYSLPQTGEQGSMNMIISGVILIGLAYLVRKKQIKL